MKEGAAALISHGKQPMHDALDRRSELLRGLILSSLILYALLVSSAGLVACDSNASSTQPQSAAQVAEPPAPPPADAAPVAAPLPPAPTYPPPRELFSSSMSVLDHSKRWIDEGGLDLPREAFKTLVTYRALVSIALAGDTINIVWVDGVTYLTPEEATVLSKAFSSYLFLPDLETVDTRTAQSLNLSQKSLQALHLDSLKQLDPMTARALADWKDTPAFNGPSGRGTLNLGGLESLDRQTAQALATWRGRVLHLDGLRALTPGAADALSLWGGSYMNLRGLEALDPETARALARWSGRRSGHEYALDGVRTLDAATARELAAWRGATLSLDGLTHIDVETAAALARWEGRTLSLEGLTDLDVETATALSAWRGRDLGLNALTQVDAETARVLAAWPGQSLRLHSLTNLDPEICERLTTFKGNINGGQCHHMR